MSDRSYKKALFIFRRDLRLYDNTGLIQALSLSKTVIPLFIFDQRQVGQKNTYRSDNAVQFMIESLQDLSNQIKKQNGILFIMQGHAEKVVEAIIKQQSIDAVFVNKDYTQFSIKRDKHLQDVCLQHGVDFHTYEDALLNDPDHIKTQQGAFYAVFTAFFKKSSKISVSKPKAAKLFSFYKGRILGHQHQLLKKYMPSVNPNIWVKGGTTEGLKLLKKINMLHNYEVVRDIPSDMTSNISAHNKFGTISIRHLYHTIVQQLGLKSPLIKQLYWRDFFYYVAYHSPFVFGNAYQKKYNTLWWSTNRSDFNRWCKGSTGFPIVDAGMRQLNATGYMHNRVRMIVASFLTKDLHINWLWGEKYFAQRLVDYDPCVNNGSWQWVASTGCDAQPYFRVFNPWLQQKKFDSECVYIKKWIPELIDVPNKIIHTWYKENAAYAKKYPSPMISHENEKKRALTLFRKR